MNLYVPLRWRPWMRIVICALLSLACLADDSKKDGQGFLDALPTKVEDSKDVRWYRMTMKAEEIGWARLEIESIHEEGGDRYKLVQEMLMRLPNGKGAYALIAAELTHELRPLRIRLARHGSGLGPDGWGVDVAEVDGDKVRLNQEGADATAEPREVALTKEPVVFGLEFLYPLLDRDRIEDATVWELNPQNGELTRHTFQHRVEPDGRKTLFMCQGDAADKETEMRWDEDPFIASMTDKPMVAGVVSEEVYKALEARFPRPERK